MLHLRVVCPQDMEARVLDTLGDRVGVVAVSATPESSHGTVISADVAREAADGVLSDLRDAGIGEHGLIALDPIDAAFGALVDKAEEEAPGEGADALIWDELSERIGEDSTLTGTFVAFMVLATLLAGIGVVTDSQITIVGAMVVGPEFGPLAGLAMALVRRRPAIARRAATALVVGFVTAIVIVALFTALARWAGLVSPADIAGPRETDFIYHPGWFSLITALVAGTAGMLSLSSAKSAVLVGVFISVTTIPAAGNAAVAGVLGDWHETWLSLAQLGINLVGITAAGVVTLWVRIALQRHGPGSERRTRAGSRLP
ncbi:MAG TPA: DUF389 domain-containing protein [Jatrophihabitans sp.]|jgi:uncharacterized hydrophobic protein (TIGR00271 family)